MAQTPPLVSVVLPVYNGARTVRRAIDSILMQTMPDFELLVIDDGSEDATPDLVAGYTDPRVRRIRIPHSGLVPALNRGLAVARGALVARMDADDEALPLRFEAQTRFLAAHPSVAVVGTAARIVYSDGTERVRRRPLDTAAIRKNIVRICPFTHSSVMIRRSVFGRVGPYDAAKDGSRTVLVEDYDLWVRILAAGFGLANLPDVLMICYREPDSIVRRRSVTMRLRQQVGSRVDIIRRLGLGWAAYFNLAPVITLSLLGRCGVRLDWAFNLLSRTGPVRAAGGETAR